MVVKCVSYWQRRVDLQGDVRTGEGHVCTIVALGGECAMTATNPLYLRKRRYWAYEQGPNLGAKCEQRTLIEVGWRLSDWCLLLLLRQLGAQTIENPEFGADNGEHFHLASLIPNIDINRSPFGSRVLLWTETLSAGIDRDFVQG